MNNTYFRRLMAVSLAGALSLSALTGCGNQAIKNTIEDAIDTLNTQAESESTADTSDTAVQEPAAEEAPAAEPVEAETSAEDNAGKMTGDWEYVYTLYHSEYGNEGESYDSMTMSTDLYSPDAKLMITERDGKLYADYMFNYYESADKYCGMELSYKEEAAYSNCENTEWCYIMNDPFAEDPSNNTRMTAIGDDRVITVNEYIDGEYGTDTYYDYCEVNVFLRSDSPLLENKDDLRFFETIEVSSVRELLDNVKNNTKLILKGGVYDFSLEKLYNAKSDFVTNEYGAFIIQGVSNFCIQAADGAEVLICVDEAYDPVMNFRNSENVYINNITAGHNVEPGYCSGSVLEFSDSNSINIDGCKLYGSGTYGVSASNTNYLNVQNSEIYECTYGLLDFYNVYSANFDNCKFRDSKDMSMIVANQSYSLYFNNCEFTNNFVDPQYPTCYFVELSDDYSDVAFTDCRFEGNEYAQFANGTITQVNCTVIDTVARQYFEEQENEALSIDYQYLQEKYEAALTRQDEIDTLLNSDASLNQQTMNEYAAESYNLWDDLLNETWNYLKENLDETTMEKLTEEEKKWIKDKEERVTAAGAEFEGGSMQAMVENNLAASVTRDRAEELLQVYLGMPMG